MLKAESLNYGVIQFLIKARFGLLYLVDKEKAGHDMGRLYIAESESEVYGKPYFGFNHPLEYCYSSLYWRGSGHSCPVRFNHGGFAFSFEGWMIAFDPTKPDGEQWGWLDTNYFGSPWKGSSHPFPELPRWEFDYWKDCRELDVSDL